ncbi:MAG: ParB N-terminal domain-containing protein [Thermoguttaceae bacterium]
MFVRDRVVDFRRVKASELRPHPKNWRTHPPAQRDALRGILAEIGYAGALLARTLPDGSLELIDGHLRAETTPDSKVPVLILDLDDREAAKLLTLHDPLAAMAESNEETLAELLDQVETENAAVASVLNGLLNADRPPSEPGEPKDTTDVAADRQDASLDMLPEAYQVVVECRDESQQRLVFERLTGEGYCCRLLML